MRIITLTCPECGTVVAGNVIENQREMKCPRATCSETLRFTDLDEEDRRHLLEHREKYTMEQSD
ncbi:hypothetical protein [Halogeometricum sp. CBA1124]|uniref:hypothetical protein n=1 Tax=Halogeometricum sp. CBA1124 TaxID=2668071 RepID=UPI00142CA2CD|nr:hypothetical protein [Halogeometricum sp. CBA1124]MUV57109.1 hypothetical protein [Halogeometricum sp. CBA1124]